MDLRLNATGKKPGDSNLWVKICFSTYIKQNVRRIRVSLISHVNHNLLTFTFAKSKIFAWKKFHMSYIF